MIWTDFLTVLSVANSQKTSVQLETLQNKLEEAIHQRDEARLQLHSSEEAALQHQEAVTRLQQVLQDFQKNQARDVAMATERERRKYDHEKEKSADLEVQIKQMKVSFCYALFIPDNEPKILFLWAAIGGATHTRPSRVFQNLWTTKHWLYALSGTRWKDYQKTKGFNPAHRRSSD